MSFVPPGFGGFVSTWDPRGPRALIVRFGEGKPIEGEGLRLTPLNLLQLRAQLDMLIEQGENAGYITDEHRAQSSRLPPIQGTADEVARKTPPREFVDRITGEDGLS